MKTRSETLHASLASRVLGLLLLAAFLLGLSACGETTTEAGRYVCTGVVAQGTTMEADDLYPQGASIRLGSGGKGKIQLNEESGDLSWECQGTDLLIRMDGTPSHGTLANGVMELNLMDSGVILTLVREDALEQYQERQEHLAAQWAGDWYGRWQIQDARGEFSDAWYDCCAVIQPDDGGGFTITLWDEDSSRQVPMGQILLQNPDPNEETLCSKSGYFWFSQVEEGEWVLDVSQSAYEHTLEVQGRHESAEATFDYSIVLRPWGQDWSDMPMEEQPFHYESWYLPLIRTGESMPDRIG